MAYKTIMTVLTDADLKASAIETAIACANRHDAHLDILCLGIDRTQAGYYYAGAGTALIQEALQRAEEDATAIEAAAKARLGREGLRWSVETAVVQMASLSGLVAQRARFADLAVMPTPYGERRSLENEATLEAVLFDGRTPVLVMPHGAELPAGKRVVIAWNESIEALAAIRKAMTLLKSADLVNIVLVDPPQHSPDRSDPGGMLSQMLGRHGIKADISVLAKTMPRVSDVLLRHVDDTGADLMVMGAYGHSRFREAIFGGATRNMLQGIKVPIFMAH